MSEECSCGKFYQDADGVEMCQSNRHGNTKDHYNDKSQFEHSLEIYITTVCSECDEPLTSKRGESRGDIEFRVSPHHCQIDAPE